MTAAPAATQLAAARSVLKDTFGHSDFRPAQADALVRVLAGETLLVVWPTGSGKSLLYQLPALLDRGPTLVISPLIALMQDQWRALRERRVEADALHSHLDAGEVAQVLQRVRAGRVRLLYLAPERLRDPRLLHALEAAPHPVARIAVDEAHCITEWGHDFREDYMEIPRARRMLGQPPMLLLTATATPQVRDDIRRCMQVPDCAMDVADLHRPNLWLARRRVQGHREKLKALGSLVRQRDGVGIVYCATRDQTGRVAAFFTEQGVRAAAYHAGVPAAARAEIQAAFLGDDLDCVAATNAFGMGIDKPDIRWIVHYAHPGSIEAYYQEIGRAGRDGLGSHCTLLFSARDAQIHRRFIRNVCPPVDAVISTFRRLLTLTAEDGQLVLTRPEAERLKHDLYLLEQAGVLEREWRRGYQSSLHLRVQPDDAALEAPSGRARAVWDILDSGHDFARQGGIGPADVVGQVARKLAWSPARVEQALYDLDTAGLVAYRPADGALVYRVRADQVSRAAAAVLQECLALRRRLRSARLAAIRRYGAASGCLWEALLRHFSGRLASGGCGHCSACAARTPGASQALGAV